MGVHYVQTQAKSISKTMRVEHTPLYTKTHNSKQQPQEGENDDSFRFSLLIYLVVFFIVIKSRIEY